jgi:hypothetical protein
MLLFLDIDGVMVPAKNWQRPVMLEDGFPAFSATAVAVLKKIISRDTIVILTTSHRSRFTIDEWKVLFAKRGIEIGKLSRLPKYKGGLSRKEELMERFKTGAIHENFLIIDDDTSLNDLPPYIKDRVIQTKPIIGLTEGHLSQINAVINQSEKGVSIADL